MKQAYSNPLISIILPIYNTESYLKKCIESVLNQKYDNLEIICIDDGSTDNSGLILDEYARKDFRIKALHKKNGGESNARNTGLQIMSGQYIGFIDCDDWIEPDMYETLLTNMIEKKVDIVASAWFRDIGSVSEKISNRLPASSEVFERETLLNYLYKRDDYRGFAYMWDKLYKRELFYDINGKLILFDEDLALGGDVLYLAKLVLNAKRAIYIDKAFYHYNQRDASGCHTRDLNKLEDWLEAYKRVIAYIQERNIKTEAMPWIKRFMAYHSSNVAESAYMQECREVLIRCQKIMEQYESEYISTNQQYPDRIIRYNKILKYKLSGGLVNEVE
jgi:glycosyltransferase involved in cell wall biosynthesis